MDRHLETWMFLATEVGSAPAESGQAGEQFDPLWLGCLELGCLALWLGYLVLGCLESSGCAPRHARKNRDASNTQHRSANARGTRTH